MSIDRQKVIDTAQKYAAKGQFDKAIVEYMRVVKEDPSDVRILLKIGDLQVRKGDKDDAIATYSRVANGYDAQGFFLKAIAVYKQILSIDPNLTELYTKLAALYVKLGLVPDAIAHLDALAARYARGGQDEKLVAVYRHMVEIDPANVPCHIKLAELYSKLGRADDAAREFEAGGTLLREAGRADDWAKVSERLLFHRPNDVALAKDLARHYLERQDAKRALPKLQVGFKANPKDVETLELLAAAFRELGQLPKTISVMKEIARIHQETGKQEQRLETYRRVLELAPNDTEAKDALRGASRLARRPSSPPPAPEAQAAARKPTSPSAPAVAAVPPPARAAATAPRVVEEEPEEVLLVDAEEEPADEFEPPTPYRPATSTAAAPPMHPRGAPPTQHQHQHQHQPAPPHAAKRQETGPAPMPPQRAVRPPPAPEPPPPPPVDPAAEVSRIVGEAEIFLKYGLKQKAVAHLARALEFDPVSIDVHVRLRDMHLELGDTAGAVGFSVRLAHLIAETDPASAMAELNRALEVDPSNPDAIALFEHLGGAVAAPPDESTFAAEHSGEPDHGYAEHDPYAQQQHQHDPYAADGAGAEHDPYAAQGYDDPYAQQQHQHDPYAQHHHDPYGAEGAVAEHDPYAAQAGGGGGGGAGRDIEEGLDEAEFFVTQGLYDEARETLQQLLAQHPAHPLVLDRVEELEAMLQAQAMPQDDQSFALAEKLAEEVDNVQQASGASIDAGGEMIDVETVFAQFKKGVEKTVSADDADTHYDLGIAYKEMGLVEDAASEFAIAAQNPKRQCIAETMIGLCFMERGDVATAIEHFKRALQAGIKTEREEMGLYFELGNAYEAVGDLSEAMYYFQKVEKRDPTFRGVRGRVQRLAAHVNSGTRQQPGQGANVDDVDRAFDDLLKG